VDLTQVFQIGDATVCVIKVGDFLVRLKDILQFPENGSQNLNELYEKPILLPSNAVLIKLGSVSIVVDPNDYSATCPPGSKEFPPNYLVPPSLVEQLEKNVGILPGDISHVVITHAHYDHYAAVTSKVNGVYQPTFPRAQYFLGRLDWIDREVHEPEKIKEVAETLGVINDRKMLQLLDGQTDLSPEITVIASPGETRGHQLVKVSSNGHVLYYIGDLFHNSIEIENPKFMPRWASTESNLVSRKSLMQAASSENAVIVPSHMTPGRLEKDSTNQFVWKEI
jgi:glyoxylase-like metal-dependent hydrolase (beta-lactamase superfamily II)